MANPQISASSELLANYKAAAVMPADAAFSALQTSEGHSLLFSIGTDGVPYLTREAVGTRTGWQKANLAHALDGVASAKSLAVAQNGSSANIHMALAAGTGGDDALFLSLHNSASDTSWADAPSWTALPFDAAPVGGALEINNVFVSEASDSEYIVVDIVRPGATTISRYFIDSDPAKPLSGQAWNVHDVAAQFEAEGVSCALGRRSEDQLDGIYTLGTAGGVTQLLFQPLYNAADLTRQAPPAFLTLPPGAPVATAMAAVRRPDDSTDLFVAAGRTIYYFSPDNQDQDDVGVVLLDNVMFAGVEQLYGFRSATELILWGLNGAHQIFYTRCPAATIEAGPWSAPLPLRSDVHRIAPYVNRANDGNSFFAHVGDMDLKRAVQARDSTTWNYHDVHLDPPDGAKAFRASSYTTRIQVRDPNGRPLPNAEVQLSAVHRVGVDVNGFYQVLDTAPIAVRADATGAINIIEWVSSPRGTALRATGPDGTTVDINAMAGVMAKASSLDSSDKLTGAMVPKKDGSPPDRPLVPSGPNAPSAADIATAAKAFGQLGTIAAGLPAGGSGGVPTQSPALAPAPGMRSFAVVHRIDPRPRPRPAGHVAAFGISLGDVLHPVESAAGDVLSAAEHAADSVVSVAQEAGSGLWHFLAKIGDQTYSFVIDSVEKVVGAVVAVYNATKTAIEDLIAWLEFLMEWPHFMRTKRVCASMVRLAMRYVSDHAADLKPAFAALLTRAKTEVDDWAGLKDTDAWTGSIPDGAKSLDFSVSSVDVSSGFSSPAMYVYHHFVDYMLRGPGGGGSPGRVYEEALSVLENEADVMMSAALRLASEVAQGAVSGDVEGIVKKSAAIVVDAFLEGTEDVSNALFDVLASEAPGTFEKFDENIYIPVVSDILQDVFGVDEGFSWLDFVLLCGAIPGSLVCHSTTGSWPFDSDNGFSDDIIAASSLEDFIARRKARSPVRARAFFAVGDTIESGLGTAFDTLTTYQAEGETAKIMFVVTHCVAGVAQMINAILVPPAFDDDNMTIWVDRTLIAVCGAVSGLALAVSSTYAPMHPIRKEWMAWIARVAGLLTFALKAVCFIREETPTQVKVGLYGDAFLADIQLICSLYHMFEMRNDDASDERSAAYIDEATNILNSFTRFATAMAMLAKDPDDKAAAMTAVIGFTLEGAALEFANAGVIGRS